MNLISVYLLRFTPNTFDFEIRLGALLLQRRGGAKHSPYMRTQEIHQKSTEHNDLENEPGHVWKSPVVSGVTRDDI